MIDSVEPHREKVAGGYEFPDALLADGFDEALVGYGRQYLHDVAIYDCVRCIEILQSRDGMTEEDANEHFEYNVVGAWVGKNTPVFMSLSDAANVGGKEG